ncbi:Hypothetical predicted protein [Mytilus galloprovincialis]|uniref:Uncharacterized protein n=1 Tax=Mytilus galloprovincialis TaxID=29158 RepID=A0A8B6CRD4_MYTGA|nr:Hypothetical predicted protein [Mytilus galloprovincialis]
MDKKTLKNSDYSPKNFRETPEQYNLKQRSNKHKNTMNMSEYAQQLAPWIHQYRLWTAISTLPPTFPQQAMSCMQFGGQQTFQSFGSAPVYPTTNPIIHNQIGATPQNRNQRNVSTGQGTTTNRLGSALRPDFQVMRRSSIDLLQEDVQKSLQNEWTESFSSAFHQMRAQQCPYFYVCTHQFSVLFRAKGLAGSSSMCAFLTPTTRGLRESLKNEDIEFSMPVLDNKKRKSAESLLELEKENQEITDKSKSTPNPKDEEEEDEDLIDTDEGAHVWLESIGLDKKSFPSLDPNKVKIQREGFRVIDNRPESLVYVEGTSVHGLFNFLLNCRSCIATSGPQAGVPPSILSPSSFKGAALKSHKVKHFIARQPDVDGNIRQVHILEVAGQFFHIMYKPYHLSYIGLKTRTLV